MDNDTPEWKHLEVKSATDVVQISFADGHKRILDEGMIREIREELSSVTSGNPEKQVEIDLGDVLFMSSAMLSTIEQVHQRYDKRIRATNLRPNVFEVRNLMNYRKKQITFPCTKKQ